MYPFPENIPDAPPPPVISRSGLVNEGEDEDEDQHQPRGRQKSIQQPVQEQRQSKNKRKKKRKKRAKNHQEDGPKQKADESRDPDEETGEKKLDVEIEYVSYDVTLSWVGASCCSCISTKRLNHLCSPLYPTVSLLYTCHTACFSYT
jgi:hypothetical protein